MFDNKQQQIQIQIPVSAINVQIQIDLSLFYFRERIKMSNACQKQIYYLFKYLTKGDTCVRLESQQRGQSHLHMLVPNIVCSRSTHAECEIVLHDIPHHLCSRSNNGDRQSKKQKQKQKAKAKEKVKEKLIAKAK